MINENRIDPVTAGELYQHLWKFSLLILILILSCNISFNRVYKNCSIGSVLVEEYSGRDIRQIVESILHARNLLRSARYLAPPMLS